MSNHKVFEVKYFYDNFSNHPICTTSMIKTLTVLRGKVELYSENRYYLISPKNLTKMVTHKNWINNMNGLETPQSYLISNPFERHSTCGNMVGKQPTCICYFKWINSYLVTDNIDLCSRIPIIVCPHGVRMNFVCLWIHEYTSIFVQ